MSLHYAHPRATILHGAAATIRAAAAALAIALALAPPARAQVGSLADGTLVGWGLNTSGQTNVPSGVFTAVDAGTFYGLGVRADGTLAGWGSNSQGQITVPTGTFTALAAGTIHSLAVRADGTLAGWGNNSHGETFVPGGTFLAIAAGDSHSLGLRADGTLAGWGSNDAGETTLPTGTFSAIAAGIDFSVGVRSDGTLAAWGSNFLGQRTVPSGTFTAVALGNAYHLALRTDGTLVGWLNNTNVPPGAFIAIDVGLDFNLALRADGSLAASGSNNRGQTNVPSGVFTAIAAGFEHGLALRGLNHYEGDLLVSGAGPRANLNRSITVANDASILSPMNLYNNPTMTVGGQLLLSANGKILGAGTISADGIDLAPGASALLSGNLTVNSSAPLSGGGNLAINQARLTAALSNTTTFTGGLSIDSSGWIAFTGAGVVSPHRLTVSKQGEVRLAAGQRIAIGDGGSSNDGVIQVIGNPLVLGGNSELESRGQFSNDRAGSITARAATLRFTGGLSNAGNIAITGPGASDVHGAVNNNRGSILITGGATAVFHGDVTQNGTLTVSKVGSTTSIAVFLGTFSGEGGVTGGGDVFIEGALQPGNSPAAVRFGGNLYLAPASTTRIEIAGTTAGTQYDQLIVDQTASLAGALDVSLLDGFSPAPLDSFTALTAAQRQSRFTTHAGLDIPGPLVLAPIYSPTSLTLIATLPGDANLDGKVSFADFQRLELGFGNPDASWPRGDFDHDGAVTFADFQILRQNFGVTTAAQAAALDAFAVAHNVPEPGGVALFAVALAATARRHRRD